MTRPLLVPPRPLEAPAERNDGGDDDNEDEEEEEDDNEAAGGPCGADESAMFGAVSFTHRHTTGADAGLEVNGEDDGGDIVDDEAAAVGSSGVEKLRPSEPPDSDDAAAVFE